jgi:hypothetical protein
MSRYQEQIHQSNTLAAIRLVAGAVGPGAVATSVVQFDVAAPVLIGAEAADIFTVIDDANGGTRIQPNRIGLYSVKVTLSSAASLTHNYGIGYGAIPTNYAADPVVGGAFVWDSGTVTVPAATIVPYSGQALIPHTGVGLPGAPVVFAALASDGSGAAPVGLTLAQCSLDIVYMGLSQQV